MKLKFKRSNKLGNNLGQATSLTLFYTPLYSLQNCEFGLFPFFRPFKFLFHTQLWVRHYSQFYCEISDSHFCKIHVIIIPDIQTCTRSFVEIMPSFVDHTAFSTYNKNQIWYFYDYDYYYYDNDTVCLCLWSVNCINVIRKNLIIGQMNSNKMVHLQKKKKLAKRRHAKSQLNMKHVNLLSE